MRPLLVLAVVLVACSGSGTGGAGGGSATAGGSGSTAGGSGSTAGGTGSTAGGTGTTAGGTGSTAGGTGTVPGGIPPVRAPSAPAVQRGEQYRGTTERFNRYYTDPAWAPLATVYVSPTGTGTGMTAAAPASVTAGLNAAMPGTRVVFQRGTYAGCYELGDTKSGTYDQPIVLYAERNMDGSRGVRINCCATGRQTCINLEASSYVAVDGFELVGGRYGVRAVGADYPAAMHQRGIAVLNNDGHDQNNDPFFTGQSDWLVIEKNLGHGAGTGDGHGIYLSNGSDYNIARLNELWSNASADFQINADPASTCMDVSVPYTDPRCDGYADQALGQGASDYMLVEGNFFHHGNAQGANFTSVRRSVVRNNIFAIYARHGVSFWQETPNANLGSSDNLVLHNLFVTNQSGRQALQFIESSTRNRVENNLLVAVTLNGTTVSANPNGLLLEVDATVSANTYLHNYYVSGTVNGRTPNAMEHVNAQFMSAWFTGFPTAVANDPLGFKPAAGAPFLNLGQLATEAAIDRTGAARAAPVDVGPFELP